MMRVMTGLWLLKPYYRDSAYKVYGEHDIIGAYPTDLPIPIIVYNQLIELGWYQTSPDENYDPNSSWEILL